MENGDDWVFPADGFSGRGRVEAHEVRCLSRGRPDAVSRHRLHAGRDRHPRHAPAQRPTRDSRSCRRTTKPSERVIDRRTRSPPARASASPRRRTAPASPRRTAPHVVEDVPEAEPDIRHERFGDLLRGADPRRLAVARVVLADPGVDPPRLGRIVADDQQAQAERPLDLGLVAADPLAPLAEDLVLVADELEVAAGVPDVGVAGDRGERLLLAVAADQDRQPRLDRRRVVADARPCGSAGRAPSPSRRGACRA